MLVGFICFYFGTPHQTFSQNLSSESVNNLFDIEDFSSEQVILEKSKQLIQNGKPDIALELFEAATEHINRPGFAFCSSYLNLVALLEKKNLYDKATNLFLVSLSDEQFSDKDYHEMKQEKLTLSMLIDQDKANALNEAENSPAELARTIQSIWISLDPTPNTNANQRLIEHRNRYQAAMEQYPDPDANTGLDARGVAYLRYGEPDVIFDRPFNFSRGELYSFVTEFQMMTEEYSLIDSESDFGSIETTQSADSVGDLSDSRLNLNSARRPSRTTGMGMARVTDELIHAIYQDPFVTSPKIWIYYRFDNDMDENLALYFAEQKTDVYKEINSLDDWIPMGLYTSSRFNAGFTAALPLQYLAYQRLMYIDRQFMDAYNNLQNQIFNHSIERSSSELINLARNVKANHQQIVSLRQMNAPSEYSTEREKIPEIPLNINQYRSFNEEGNPVYITFIESYPTIPFLNDYVRNQDLMVDELEDPDIILDTISDWYVLEQGVELYSETMEPKGRLRDRPLLHLDSDKDHPAVMIADIPLIGERAYQTFYVKLLNRHPDTNPAEESVYPDELRGLGKITHQQESHIDTSDEGIILGDLIIGYGRINQESARFPFIVNHERMIPENEIPVIYFEVHQLQKDETGFARFEVDYRFNPERRSFNLFRRSRNNLNGTLEFSTNQTRFTESLEFDNISLRSGNYTLHWTVRDLVNDRSTEQSIDIRIVEPGQN